MSEGALRYLIHHVVLPPKLPQQDDSSALREGILLDHTVQALRSLQAILRNDYTEAAEQVGNVVSTIDNLIASRASLGHVSQLRLGELIRGLATGSIQGAIPLEIKAQNAGIIISRHCNDVVFEVFELSPVNESVMSTPGRLVRTFPTYASKIPITKLEEDGLIDALSHTIETMSGQEIPEFQPQVHKGGKNHGEIRDTTHPALVTDYLINVLSALGDPTEVSGITKHTREEVMWANALLPWRRSPLWLMLRIAMQIQYSRHSTNTLGSLSLYKTSMVCVMSSLLDTARTHGDWIDNALMQAISAKLSRRLRKLKLVQSESFYQLCSQPVRTSLLDAYDFMQKRWDNIRSFDAKSSMIAVNKDNIRPNKDLAIKIPLLDQFIGEIAARSRDLSAPAFQPSWEFPDFPKDSLPSYLRASGEQKYFEAAEFEQWVEQHLLSWLEQHINDEGSCGRLRELIERYHDFARPLYSNPAMPPSMSVMYLTIAELWIACDKSASHRNPLLLDFDPEVNLDTFQYLCLPLQSQLRRLNKVEEYLRLRKKRAIPGAPSIFHCFGDKASFAVKYFEKSATHQLLRTRIEEGAAIQRKQKREELARVKQKYENLTAEAEKMVCDETEVITDTFNNFTEMQHSPFCSKCRLKATAAKLSIAVHEWPLSPLPSEAKATVFELQIPEDFSNWRDATIILMKNVLGHNQETEIGPQAEHTLMNHHSLGIFQSLPSNQRIKILSSAKPLAGSHYKVKRGVSMLTEDNVCVASALHYRYYDGNVGIFTSRLVPTDRIGEECTYQLPKRSSQLQRYVQGCGSSGKVTPNSVIASLSECPHHISLDEYKAFGTLSIGFTIRYANILVQLAMPTLDFSKVETHCLITQAVQQAGPPSLHGQIERISHRVLLEDSFCDAFLAELEGALPKVAENWESWRALATFVQLSLRIFNLTSSSIIRSRCKGCLEKARLISLEWLKILKHRGRMSTNCLQRSELYSRATEIALVCISTLDVDGSHLEDVLSSPGAVSALLQSSIIVQENENASSSEHEYLHRVLLQSRRTLLLRLFWILQRGILDDRNFQEQLNEAVSSSWSAFQPEGRWSKVQSPHGHWLHVNCCDRVVHFNLLTGELLVNGVPLSRLPQEYSNHSLYATLFQGTPMEVVPTSEPGMAFSAKVAYRGYELDFGMRSKQMLIVASQAGTKFDLLPAHFFKGIFPSSFIEDYFHWYEHGSGTIELRPRVDPWSSEGSLWRLKKFGTAWTLEKDDLSLLNPNSLTARTLAKIFEPLAYQSHLHLMFEKKSGTVSIELPKLQLGFYVKQDEAVIHSRQYRGMIIDEIQALGTLTGLSNKLVLKHTLGINDRIILIPDGSVQYTKSEDHVLVSISRDDATKSHAYQLDSILGRLVDNGSLRSKLFLCYLHALTAHCIVDPFTGYTGTEAALSILRSAAVASFDILSHQDLQLLKLIANLTPGRTYYPQHAKVMQMVSWDTDLSFTAQHPGFLLSVENLFNEARKGKVFHAHDGYVEPPKLDFAKHDLVLRDLIRSSTFRVDGFGAESYTHEDDRAYKSRTQLGVDRGQRSFFAASLVLRDQLALNAKVHAQHFRQLLRENLHNATVRGKDFENGRSSLSFSPMWLLKASTFLPKMLCNLHAFLSGEPEEFNKFYIAMWLSTVAFSNTADMNIVQAFVAFYRLSGMATIDIPALQKYELAEGDSPTISGLQTALETGHRSFQHSPEYNLPKHVGETKKRWTSRKQRQFRENQSTAVEEYIKAIQPQWPCKKPTKPNFEGMETYIDSTHAMPAVLGKFRSWYENRTFYQYIAEVAATLERQQVAKVLYTPNQEIVPSGVVSLPCSGSFTIDNLFALTTTFSWPATPKELDIPLFEQTPPQQNTQAKDRLTMLCQELETQATSTCETDYVSHLRGSCDSLIEQPVRFSIRSNISTCDLRESIETYLAHCRQHVFQIDELLKNAVLSGGDIAACIGHGPRVSSIFWLMQLNKDRFDHLPKHWQAAVIKFALAITELHRAQRLLKLAELLNELAEELRNCGHQNWKPEEFPETLLLEAESGIIVREVQKDISMVMRSPPNAKNSVMQLNMGEGKSSVIVPDVAVTVADGNILSRVIVAKPQSKQMLQMLVAKLGGLLNRRIYHMPFSRALKISAADAKAIGKMYEECIANRGILLVQPEHILSFKLMAIECLIIGKNDVGRSLLKTQHLFDTQSRDIVDESDENFNVKFELVYTMGTQRPIELSPERWSIMHSVLALVSRYASEVKSALPISIEVDDRWEAKGRYPRVRILRSDADDMLLDRIANHICSKGFTHLAVARQSKSTIDAVYRYIRQPELSQEEIAAVEEGDFWTDSTKDILLLVRGMIACGILRFALHSKRWRVNYGSDPTRVPKTKLAVPYRSKDSPSQRSEFSHPEVVIALTSLTYYYGGLSDEELFDSFTHLLKSDQADVEYGDWIKFSKIPESFRRLKGINIKDRYQCVTQIFPLLCYSKGAIDYYLSHIVFPKEMKEFPNKLSASGWDIGAVKPNPTTGFSGTNDSRHVLPLSVEHVDLAKQKHTNALVLAYLLQDESSIELLPNRTSSETSDAELLLNVVTRLNPEVRVILDVGAQILEMNNYEVAEAWLQMSDADTTKAIVFFNDHEDLVVLNHRGNVELLQTSAFSKHLEDCLVYLDEAHTRGTDLILPKYYRAAVTLGANLTKDRLVQACMRMRKLGKGQSVVFCIPQEIQTKILECSSKTDASEIQVSDVLVCRLAISQTWADLRRSMPLWATQGRRYETHKHLLNGVDTTASQAQEFLEEEAQTLDYRYRPRRPTASLEAPVDWDVNDPSLTKILQRCRDFESMAFDAATLQEEQERELSPEIQAECQIQRPPAMTPEEHHVHPDLIHLINTGVIPQGSRAFMSAFRALSNTSAAKFFDLSQFPTGLLVTQDFMRTVKRPLGRTASVNVTDAYLRPVQWVLSWTKRRNTTNAERGLIVISPFEADRLLLTIGCTKDVTLHVYSPRPNLGYRSLDNMDLYCISGGTFDIRTISRSLIVQLNLFAGQLYFDSYNEYTELCDFLGLSWTEAKEGQTVQADGFIKPPVGKWGLKTSAVKFLREFMKLRREGEGMEKTHLGKMLDGVLLEPGVFEQEN
ncbi:hypothetical protein CC80DRAFT_424735 [Byssothecium circinans]|uniref:ubiquitinyl hydrolase 1 n=1 Tax=Byssothecium circinans TaxID=147558 RepID=A0A6A5TGE9_9PLEO|nr:hypothetical protein CC80DRAFT_424735 [Byssothecium circinans]